MREFLKVMCVVVLAIAAIVAAIAWFADKPDGMTWLFRIVSPIIAVVALVMFVRMDRQRDKVPDYLSRRTKKFFERNGLCFDVEPQFKEDGSFWFFIHYQNRYENPCKVYICLDPSSGKFGVEPVMAHFICEAAGFGVAAVPARFNRSAPGQTCRFNVGATVQYPKGKGKMLRFRDGDVLRMDANFKDAGFRIAQILLLFTGTIAWKSHATVTCQLPHHLKPGLPIEQKTHSKTLWKLGDRPLA